MLRDDMEQAQKVLKDWKGDSYTFGEDILKVVGKYVREFGVRASLVVMKLGSGWIEKFLEEVKTSLRANDVSFEMINGARPNAPREDVYRISLQVARSKPDVIVALGGGSTIDAVKAAAILNTYTPTEVMEILRAEPKDADSIEPYFGTGIVSKIKEETGKNIMPVVAIQTTSSSAAHLTKYSNITDPVSGQKKLIIDEAIVPPRAIFDFRTTLSSPMALTLDGGLDGIAHAWEVFMGANGPAYGKIKEVATLCIRLIVEGLQRV
ncbi:MAG: iron-containing alcohol dehydrogenase, partial [Thermodesulfobacteriota bacterium]